MAVQMEVKDATVGGWLPGSIKNIVGVSMLMKIHEFSRAMVASELLIFPLPAVTVVFQGPSRYPAATQEHRTLCFTSPVRGDGCPGDSIPVVAEYTPVKLNVVVE